MIRFRDAIRTKTFALSADLSLGRATQASDVVAQAKLLGASFDALQVPDSHDGRLQMSAQAAATLLLQQNVDPVVHLTGRDRNRIALENDLLGLAVLGVTSILLTRGEELPPEYRPLTRQVLELSGEDLVTTARLLGEDESVPAAEEFLIGTAATAFSPRATWKPTSLALRVAAGASFIQTQICFNLATLRRYLSHLVEARLTWRCSVMAGVAVIPNAAYARLLKDKLSGAVIPEKVVRRLEQARDAELEGIKLAAETLQKLQEIPGISGANLVTPGDPATLIEAVRTAGLRD